ncbi:GNAT family N-acetyltransferase [Streptosporangium sp. NPDC050855]|uniref:GNAT family N-acetyltransferase n=1 Tax=Streptosporangium sp. NPDC050855 TaxID=3366194 RepID=UPI003797C9CB
MVEVELRGWRPDDVPVVLDAFRSPDMADQAARPVDTARAALEWIGIWGFRDDAQAFAVVCGGEVVGNVAVSNIDAHDTGWVSYWTLPRARGRGVAMAATMRLAEWAFLERGLFRLELGHRIGNVASCAVATRAGFLPEGVERAKLRHEGVRYDVERHARLATDRPAPPGLEPGERNGRGRLTGP